MGTESRWNGVINFTPPVAAAVLRGTEYDVSTPSTRDFMLLTEREDSLADEEGWEVRRTRTMVMGVRSAHEYNFQGTFMAGQLQALLNLLNTKNALPASFPGFIQRLTEDGDLSRLYVREGQVHEVPATISWPGWEY